MKIFDLLLLLFSIALFILIIALSKEKNKYVDVSREEVATIFERLLAYTIDIALLSIAFFIVYVVIDKLTNGLSIKNPLFLVPLNIIIILYFSILESSNLQASVGKHFIGIVVCNNKREKVGFWTAMFRSALTYLSDMTLLLGYVVAIFTKYNQFLHDILSNTMVVKRSGTSSV